MLLSVGILYACSKASCYWFSTSWSACLGIRCEGFVAKFHSDGIYDSFEFFWQLLVVEICADRLCLGRQFSS